MKAHIVPIVTILAAVLLGSSGGEAAEAGVQRSAAVKEAEAASGLTMEAYEEKSAILGKMVREFKFPTSEPEEFANIIALFDSNPAEAVKRYKTKMCRGVGFVREVSGDLTGPTMMAVVGRIEDVTRTGDATVVECGFTKTEAASVAKLKPSDRVIIRGLCFGKRSNLVLMFGCHIEGVQSPGQNNLVQKDGAPGDGVEHAADGTEAVRQKSKSRRMTDD
ncbi:MAG: hypothetical protein WC740_07030 [Verrucomicrobiia bacterium]